MSEPTPSSTRLPPAATAAHVRDRLPDAGLFAGHDWRVATRPLPLPRGLVKELETLGRVLLQFYRAVDRLHRLSREGQQPDWIANWLDRGKPKELLEIQNSPHFKGVVPRVIRPDLMLTENGIAITELDSVPGGIGLTAWLNQTYASAGHAVLGGAEGMIRGFESIFGEAQSVQIIVSEEAATYRPEMEWLAAQMGRDRFVVRDGQANPWQDSDAIYRFFELFDLANVPVAGRILDGARTGKWELTPPPKPMFEEKMLFALLWNRHLEDFWARELGGAFFKRLRSLVPFTWLLDPTPLPPQGAFPRLDLTDWHQLKGLSKKERHLILKVSGFSPQAWGARGVHLGSDLSREDWSEAVDAALRTADRQPHVLQEFAHPARVQAEWFDFEGETPRTLEGRVRLCPYYFVKGQGDGRRADLGGVLATICPADKKIIHGMPEAVMAPCGEAADGPMAEADPGAG